MNDRPLAERAIAGAMAIAFVLFFVFPVVDAALFSAEFRARDGRPGLLAPALILADARNRQALLAAVVGAIAAVTIAFVAGTLLGLACVRAKSRSMRTARALALLPGRIPAWVFPACVAATRPFVTDDILSADTPSFFWMLWIGWWGATRIATRFHEAVRAVPAAEWDSARTLARGPAATLRMILKPRLSRDFRAEAKHVAAVCLFDPSAVFFLSLSNWPIGHVARCLADGELAMLVEASAWLLWLMLIWMAVSYSIRIAIGDRARFDPDGVLFDRTHSGARGEDVPVTGKFRFLLVAAVWPLVLLAALAVRAVSGSSTGNEARSIAQFAEVDWAVRGSAISGVIMILSCVLAVGLISWWARIDRLARFANDLTSAWPMEASIVAIAVFAAAMMRPGAASTGSMSLIRIGSDLWLPLFVLTAFGGLAACYRRGISGGNDRVRSADERVRVAADAARTLGITRRQASALVRRTKRDDDPSVGPAAVALDAWWLWFSPSWALLPTWRIAAVPIGGQVLVDRYRSSVESLGFVPALGAVLAVAAVIALAGGVRSLHRPESNRKRKS